MGSIIRVDESVQIDRPPVDVWDAIADYSFDLQWRKGLLDMTSSPPGPAAAGTNVHEVVRNSGRDYVADTVVTEFEAGTAYRFEGSGTIGGVAGRREVVAGPGGTGARFTYGVELEPRSGTRLLRPILGPMVRSGLKRDLRQLKSLLEGDATAPGNSA